MSLKNEVKKCLLMGWLTHPAWQCVAMIMVDHNISHYVDETCDFSHEAYLKFLEEVGMPIPLGMMSASCYIANYYPKTSQALFQKNPHALKIFYLERATPQHYEKKMEEERRNINRHMRQIVPIRARELDKKHDWKTVK